MSTSNSGHKIIPKQLIETDTTNPVKSYLKNPTTYWFPIDVVSLLYIALYNQFVFDYILSLLQQISLIMLNVVFYVFANPQLPICLAPPDRYSAQCSRGHIEKWGQKMAAAVEKIVHLWSNMKIVLTFSFPLTLLAFFLISAIRSSNSCLVSVFNGEKENENYH